MLILRERRDLIGIGPVGDHDRLRSAGKEQIGIGFLCYKRHKRMQQLHGYAENVVQDILSLKSRSALLIKQPALGDLDIPVAERLPDEVNDLRQCDTVLILLEVGSCLGYKPVKSREDPLILERELGRVSLADIEVILTVHDNESHGIPDLVAEVTTHLDLVFLESLVITGSITCYEGESQGVGTGLLNDLERVDTVTQGLTHLTALRVSYETVDQDIAEGYIPDCVFTKVQGYTDDEVSMLTDYLRANLTDLKRKAAAINPLNAFMGKSKS